MLDYRLENIRIYVDETNYFMLRLSTLQISRPDPKKWSDSNTYYRSLFATYCTSYCCGVSKQDLSVEAHPIIVSVMRLHLYFNHQQSMGLESCTVKWRRHRALTCEWNRF